jgi:hypothetical protein
MRSCDLGKDSGILRNCIHYTFKDDCHGRNEGPVGRTHSK